MTKINPTDQEIVNTYKDFFNKESSTNYSDLTKTVDAAFESIESDLHTIQSYKKLGAIQSELRVWKGKTRFWQLITKLKQRSIQKRIHTIAEKIIKNDPTGATSWFKVAEGTIRSELKNAPLNACRFANAASLITKDVITKAKQQEGSFRVAGDKNQVEQIVSNIEQGKHPPSGNDIHTTLNAIKRLIKGPDKKQSLFTDEQKNTLFNLIGEEEPNDLEQKTKGQIIKIVNDHLATLPQKEQEGITRIFTLCKAIIENKETTKMDAPNLGTIFGPSFFPDNPDPVKQLQEAKKANNLATIIIAHFTKNAVE